jgi:ABC-2 type transport system permease protein
MRSFLDQLGFELLKLFARKRTYIGFGAFFGAELLILLLLQLPKVKTQFHRSMTQYGIDFSHFFSGLTLAYVMISWTAFLLGSLFLALVSGDIISKEIEDGTLRMMLSRPITRARILLLKYVTCVIYTWSLAIFIVASGLLLGISARGLGGLIVIDPFARVFGLYESGQGLERFGLATIMLCLIMLTISSLGFMFSCFNMKPASATILTLALYIIDNVLHNVPYFVDIQSYFLTYHMGMWPHVFDRKIPWPQLVHSLLYLGSFDVLFISLGAVYFARRDFKS